MSQLVASLFNPDSIDLPMNLAGVLKQTDGNAMNGGITPAFVEEASGAIQMLEIVFIFLAPPKVHISYLEVTPEMARGEALGFPVMLGPPDVIHNPFNSVILM